MFARMVTDFSVTPLALSFMAQILFYTVPLLMFEYWLERRKDVAQLASQAWGWRAAAYGYCLLMLLFFPPPATHEFIYFQF
jgi:hypothetical protein